MIELSGNNLTLEEIYKIAFNEEKVSLSEQAILAINFSYQNLERIVKNKLPVYGLNTGFGIFADQVISNEDSRKLNRNLIISHAVGTGLPLPKHVVRAAMVIRANALCKGYSGIQLNLVHGLLKMLNQEVTPVVYSKGSLGSSGDLCMLAQMALVLTRDEDNDTLDSGLAENKGDILSGSETMRKAGIKRIVLSYKDGLALINGATFSAAVLALCAYDAEFLSLLADMTTALTFEGLVGRSDALNQKLHQVRGLEGQIDSASRIRKFIHGSTLVDSDAHIQDAYSLRCAPQVNGAVRDTLAFVRGVAEREVNAATDNPLIIDQDTVISGGNFHGEPVGMAADFLSIAFSELAAIAERRLFRMMDKNLNFGLPAMLVGEGGKVGLNSGVMLLQYTAAALVLENQTLSSPDSVRSLPTSANQEDHNANAFNSALHLLQVMENTLRVIAIEYYCACRAIDLRLKLSPEFHLGAGTEKAYKLLRNEIPYQSGDANWGIEIDNLYRLLTTQDFRSKLTEILN
ncbi:MAG: histidine ammonia-lyase [Chloroflexi bacterium]|nr:histidine ammonia-lyase [Chloroflexota bacterium]